MNTMRFTLLITVFILTTTFTLAQHTDAMYDSALAKKLKADDYGMKAYVLVILKKGTANITDPKVRDSIFHGHMANIIRLANENKLLLAGPPGENDKNYEGIFIYNTADINEAKSWLNSDPAIQTKDLDAEIFPLYGPAALQQVLDLNKKLQKKHF